MHSYQAGVTLAEDARQVAGRCTKIKQGRGQEKAHVMSYIPAVHRRTGYTVHYLPAPSNMEQAFQIVTRELVAKLKTAPDEAEPDAEGMCNTIRQLVQLAAEARRSA